MIRGILQFFAILVLLLSTKSIADQIILTNGDSLQGTKIGETESHLFWQSDTFGPLSIALDKVASISPKVEILAATISHPSGSSSDESLEGTIGLSGLSQRQRGSRGMGYFSRPGVAQWEYQT